MKLNDIKMGHSHTYYCRNSQTRCYILAGHADDGACLIAEKYSIGGEMFTTEACYLTPWEEALKTVVEFCTNCYEATSLDEMLPLGSCRQCSKATRHVLAAEQGAGRLKAALDQISKSVGVDVSGKNCTPEYAEHLRKVGCIPEHAAPHDSADAMTDQDMIQWLRDICGNANDHKAYLVAERLQQQLADPAPTNTQSMINMFAATAPPEKVLTSMHQTLPQQLADLTCKVFDNEVEFLTEFLPKADAVEGFYMDSECCHVAYIDDFEGHTTTIKTADFLAWAETVDNQKTSE